MRSSLSGLCGRYLVVVWRLPEAFESWLITRVIFLACGTARYFPATFAGMAGFSGARCRFPTCSVPAIAVLALALIFRVSGPASPASVAASLCDRFLDTIGYVYERFLLPACDSQFRSPRGIAPRSRARPRSARVRPGRDGSLFALAGGPFLSLGF